MSLSVDSNRRFQPVTAVFGSSKVQENQDDVEVQEQEDKKYGDIMIDASSEIVLQ